MATWSARGLRDVEIGLLSASPEVENIDFLWCVLAVHEKVCWTGGLYEM